MFILLLLLCTLPIILNGRLQEWQSVDEFSPMYKLYMRELRKWQQERQQDECMNSLFLNYHGLQEQMKSGNTSLSLVQFGLVELPLTKTQASRRVLPL